MVKTSGFNANEHLAGLQRSQLLRCDLDHVGSAGAKCPSDASLHAFVYDGKVLESLCMANLLYMTNMSLDGYIEDQTGAFDWVNPDPVFAFITELVRPIRTSLYGRRLYETMAYWGAPLENYPPEQRDFARLWQKTDKIVFSRTLTGATTRNTRIEHSFDVEAIRSLKREAEHDITIGGAELAGLALEAGLVDECHLFLNPVVVGGGKPAFSAGVRQNLKLLETRPFGNGVIHLHYRMR
jgi:dihydrofolate reductase